MITCAALDVFEIATLIVLIQQIRLALYIDYSKPVAVIQKQLETLRMLHIRHFQWTFLLAPLLWTPLLIVTLEGFLRIDAYKTLGAAYLLANLSFGLAIIPLAIWLSKKFADRINRSPKIQLAHEGPRRVQPERRLRRSRDTIRIRGGETR